MLFRSRCQLVRAQHPRQSLTGLSRILLALTSLRPGSVSPPTLRFSGAPPGLRSSHFVRSHQAFGHWHITRPPCGFSSPLCLGLQATPPGNSPNFLANYWHYESSAKTVPRPSPLPTPLENPPRLPPPDASLKGKPVVHPSLPGHSL